MAAGYFVLALGSLILVVYAACASPFVLGAFAVYCVAFIALVLSERRTRAHIEAFFRTRPERVIATWPCDEAMWRFAIDQFARDALPGKLVGLLTATLAFPWLVVAIILPGWSMETSVAFALGSVGSLLGTLGYIRARLLRGLEHDPRRVLVLGRSFVLCGPAQLQLDSEPLLPEVADSARLLDGRLERAPGSAHALVLVLKVRRRLRNHHSETLVSIPVPPSHRSEAERALHAYLGIAARNQSTG